MKKALFFTLALATLLLFGGCTADEPGYFLNPPRTPIEVNVNNGAALSTVTIANTPLPVDMSESIPYFVGIAEGEITDHVRKDKICYNAAVGTSEEDIWGGSTSYVFPATAQQMQVVSSSIADNASGTGVRQVIIYYLDANYVQKTEIINLSGITAKNTVATDIFRINNFRAYTTGTGYKAAGNIVIRNLAGTTNYSYIMAGYNRARNSVYTVPANKTFYINDFYAGIGGLNAANMCRITFKATYDDLSGSLLTPGLFFMPYIEVVCPNGSVNRPFTIPLRFPQKTDIKVSAYTDSGSAYVEVSYRGWTE